MPPVGGCAALLTLSSPILFIFGIASHLAIFVWGELNTKAGLIVTCFLSWWTTLVLLSSLFCGWVPGLYVGSGLFISFQAGLGLSILTYRLLLHRIRRFPGSLLTAATNWSATYIAHKTQRWHAHIWRLHGIYGDFVRTGPREMSINHVDAIQPIYGKESLCLRGPWYDLGGTGLNLHRTRNPKLHAKQRPLWEQGFREMSNHISKIQKKADDFISFIKTAPQSVNAAAEYEHLAFTVMAFVIFSRDFDDSSELREEAREAYITLRASQCVLGTYGHVPWYFNVGAWVPGLIPQNVKFTRLASRMIEERRKVEPDVPDLFSSLLPTETDPKSAGFPLEWEARLAMVAGSGNVSSALTSTTFYLATNPTVLGQLQAEIDPFMIQGKFNPKDPHKILESVISETFRLQPLVPNGGERVTPPNGLVVAGQYIPGDVIVRVPTYTIFRDERYFAEPLKWIPERWTTKSELVKNSSAFIPFSTGPYSCVGRRLGMVEIRLLLANLVYHFDFRLGEAQGKAEFEDSGKDHFGMVFDKLLVTYVPRSRES